MVDLARQAGVIRLYALCHVDHQASRRVLEKGGFTPEGLLRRHTVFPNLAEAPCDTWSYVRLLRSGLATAAGVNWTANAPRPARRPAASAARRATRRDWASGTVWRL